MNTANKPALTEALLEMTEKPMLTLPRWRRPAQQATVEGDTAQ